MTGRGGTGPAAPARQSTLADLAPAPDVVGRYGAYLRTKTHETAEVTTSTGQHPALITDYDSPPTLMLVLPPHLGKDQVLSGLAQAIGQARADLAARARTFQQQVEGYVAAGDELRQALFRGQVLASDDAAACLDEAIVAAFDLCPQYDTQLAAQTAATGGQAAAAAAAFPGQQPPCAPAGGAESPAAMDAVASPHSAGDSIRPYIEAAVSCRSAPTGGGERAVSERNGRKICRRCGGRSQSRVGLGWYALSVGVPPEIDPNGFKWVGLFCTTECLAAYMPEIQRMADLADQVYAREPAR